jgi:hypothetical protein
MNELDLVFTAPAGRAEAQRRSGGAAAPILSGCVYSAGQPTGQPTDPPTDPARLAAEHWTRGSAPAPVRARVGGVGVTDG